MSTKKQVFVLSDSTGLSAEMMVNATLSQFRDTKVGVTRLTMVRNRIRLVDAIRSAKKANGLIVYTLVSDQLRRILHIETTKRGIQVVDLMGPLLEAFAEFLGSLPIGNPGIQRELSESYFRGVEAIEYTVKHDDGQDPDGLLLADLVIVGVSRTSKTPLSIFLSSQYLLRVANVPIILEVGLPHQLFRIDRNRIVGLTISATRLMEIRKTRLERAGFIMRELPPKYAEYDRIVEELEHSNYIFTANEWKVIDVTEKSIEEVASEILKLREI